MTLKNHEKNSWFVPSSKVKDDHPVKKQKSQAAKKQIKIKTIMIKIQEEWKLKEMKNEKVSDKLSE